MASNLHSMEAKGLAGGTRRGSGAGSSAPVAGPTGPERRWVRGYAGADPGVIVPGKVARLVPGRIALDGLLNAVAISARQPARRWRRTATAAGTAGLVQACASAEGAGIGLAKHIPVRTSN
jgi:hypothetical protein